MGGQAGPVEFLEFFLLERNVLIHDIDGGYGDLTSGKLHLRENACDREYAIVLPANDIASAGPPVGRTEDGDQFHRYRPLARNWEDHGAGNHVDCESVGSF